MISLEIVLIVSVNSNQIRVRQLVSVLKIKSAILVCFENLPKENNSYHVRETGRDNTDHSSYWSGLLQNRASSVALSLVEITSIEFYDYAVYLSFVTTEAWKWKNLRILRSYDPSGLIICQNLMGTGYSYSNWLWERNNWKAPWLHKSQVNGWKFIKASRLILIIESFKRIVAKPTVLFIF